MVLPRDFKFAIRYAKGEEKESVLDRNPWLAKMIYALLVFEKLKNYSAYIWYNRKLFL